MKLTASEAYRANVTQIAILLHKTPAEVRAMPWQDFCDVVEVNHANRTLDAQHAGAWQEAG